VARLSQPILDRIDLHVELEAVEVDDLVWSHAARATGASATVSQVLAARERQLARNGVLNAEVLDATLRAQTAITHSARTLLSEAMKKLGMSARGYTRVLRVAVTIADLGGCAELTDEIVAEAISYRSLDRLTNLLHHGSPFSGGRIGRGITASP